MAALVDTDAVERNIIPSAARRILSTMGQIPDIGVNSLTTAYGTKFRGDVCRVRANGTN